jgi:hypothetical protein
MAITLTICAGGLEEIRGSTSNDPTHRDCAHFYLVCSPPFPGSRAIFVEIVSDYIDSFPIGKLSSSAATNTCVNGYSRHEGPGIGGRACQVDWIAPQVFYSHGLRIIARAHLVVNMYFAQQLLCNLSEYYSHYVVWDLRINAHRSQL